MDIETLKAKRRTLVKARRRISAKIDLLDELLAPAPQYGGIDRAFNPYWKNYSVTVTDVNAYIWPDVAPAPHAAESVLDQMEARGGLAPPAPHVMKPVLRSEAAEEGA